MKLCAYLWNSKSNESPLKFNNCFLWIHVELNDNARSIFSNVKEADYSKKFDKQNLKKIPKSLTFYLVEVRGSSIPIHCSFSYFQFIFMCKFKLDLRLKHL